MNTILALAVAALAAPVVHATGAVPLHSTVAHLEGRYGGEVVAIVLDDAGDKPAHYHVDLRYPAAGTARLDVDAATLAIGAREPQRPGERWTTSLAGATAYAETLLNGHALVAELDAVDGETAHYDIDVRLADGAVARVTVDPIDRRLGWRTPPVVAP